MASKVVFQLHMTHSIRALHIVTMQRMVCELKYQINVS